MVLYEAYEKPLPSFTYRAMACRKKPGRKCMGSALLKTGKHFHKLLVQDKEEVRQIKVIYAVLY